MKIWIVKVEIVVEVAVPVIVMDVAYLVAPSAILVITVVYVKVQTQTTFHVIAKEVVGTEEVNNLVAVVAVVVVAVPSVVKDVAYLVAPNVILVIIVVYVKVQTQTTFHVIADSPNLMTLVLELYLVQHQKQIKTQPEVH